MYYIGTRRHLEKAVKAVATLFGVGRAASCTGRIQSYGGNEEG